MQSLKKEAVKKLKSQKTKHKENFKKKKKTCVLKIEICIFISIYLVFDI